MLTMIALGAAGLLAGCATITYPLGSPERDSATNQVRITGTKAVRHDGREKVFVHEKFYIWIDKLDGDRGTCDYAFNVRHPEIRYYDCVGTPLTAELRRWVKDELLPAGKFFRVAGSIGPVDDPMGRLVVVIPSPFPSSASSTHSVHP